MLLSWLEFGDSVGTLADCRFVRTWVENPSRVWGIMYLESTKVTRLFGIVMHCALPERRTLLRLFGASFAMQRTRHMNGTFVDVAIKACIKHNSLPFACCSLGGMYVFS